MMHRGEAPGRAILGTPENFQHLIKKKMTGRNIHRLIEYTIVPTQWSRNWGGQGGHCPPPNNQAVYYSILYYIKRLIIKETAQERNERRQAFFGKDN